MVSYDERRSEDSRHRTCTTIRPAIRSRNVRIGSNCDTRPCLSLGRKTRGNFYQLSPFGGDSTLVIRNRDSHGLLKIATAGEFLASRFGCQDKDH